MQHGGVQERFQYTTRAAWRRDYVDLVPFAVIGLEGDISGIGEHFSCFGIGDESGQVMDMVGGIVTCVAVHSLLYQALQFLFNGGRDACSGSIGSQPFKQVGRVVG